MLYTQQDINQLGSILGIWAHPDDESWCSAGLMKIASKNGQKIGIITATKGSSGGTSDPVLWPEKSLGKTRKKEMEDCLCYIGQVDMYWLNYEDGRLSTIDPGGAVRTIVKILKSFKPDSIVTFGPDGITGHDDHSSVSQWVSLAVKKVDEKIRILHAVESKEKFNQSGSSLDKEFNIYFNVDDPQLINEADADILLKLPQDVLDCKMCCLRAHTSQTAQMFARVESRNALRILAATECYVVQ